MTYQVLARKWRPQAFDTVVGQEAVTRTLRNALAGGRVAHAYLFTGPRGVGKTTTARLLARALACTTRTGPEACDACPSCVEVASGTSVDVIEIDAASNNGVEEIRTLRENVQYAPSRGRFKVYIVDEVHMLSGAAFNAFLKTLEEPPAHVVFILATTDPRKIPATVLSRCQRFDFKPVSPEILTRQLTDILTKEQIAFEASALPLLVRASEGSVRDALSLLDAAIAYGEGRLEETSVARLLGSAAPEQVRAIVAALLARDGAATLEAIDRAARQGEDLDVLCRDVIELTRRLLVLAVAPGAAFADLTTGETDALGRAAAAASVDDLIYLLRVFLEAQAEMRRSPYPRVELEMAAVRTTRRPAPEAIESLIAKVEAAEQRLRAMPAAGPSRPAAMQESLLEPPPRPQPVAPPPAPQAAARSSGVSGGSGAQAVVSEETDSTARGASPARVARSEEEVGAGADGGLDEVWRRVVTAMMRRKALLASVLEHARPVALRGETLVVAMAGSRFHRELLADRANRDLINQVIQEQVPGARRIDLATEEAPPTDALGHPAVQAALAAFPGEVVSVRPRLPEEGETP